MKGNVCERRSEAAAGKVPEAAPGGEIMYYFSIKRCMPVTKT